MSDVIVPPSNPLWRPASLQLADNMPATDKARIAAYWWAWCVMRGAEPSVVYDFGCGTGYGCRILSQFHEDNLQIIGVDCSAQALNYGRAYYGSDVTQFRRLDLNLPWLPLVEPQQIDLITCFDTLEALRSRDLFLEDVANGLKPSGLFLVSTSAISESALVEDSLDGRVRLSLTDSVRLLRRYFKVVSTLGDKEFFSPQCFDDPGLANVPGVGRNLIACSWPITSSQLRN